MSEHLTLVEVLAIHEDQINRYGGTHGLRDAGALQAALYRPQSGYYNDTVEEAAALWESLSQNHPFLDGNKRTAFAAVYTFLAMNDLLLSANASEAFEFLNNLYKLNVFEFDRLEPWLRSHVQSII